MLKRIMIVVLVFSSSLLAQGQPYKSLADLDGSDWVQFSDAARSGYLAGYVSAMYQAEVSAILCGLAAASEKVTADTPAAVLAKICLGETEEFHFAEVAGVAQYREGMDAFYKDFRNLQVPIPKAIGWVRDQISGRKSGAEVGKALEEWRQCHAESSKCPAPASPQKQTPPATKRQVTHEPPPT